MLTLRTIFLTWILIITFPRFSAASTMAVTWIPDFVQGDLEGSQPDAPLLQASDGNFYGTCTGGGGAAEDGTIFRYTPSGIYTCLYSFSGPDGFYPRTALIQGIDGSLYGTTQSGGPSNGGTIFKYTLGGSLTTLASFNRTNGTAPTALMEDSSGNFYGTTYGAFFDSPTFGTAFEIPAGGTITTLALFPQDVGPEGGLTLGSDGNYYGATFPNEYSNSSGMIFKLTPGGTLSTVSSFSNGLFAVGAITQGIDGNFYGTASNDTIFKVIPGQAPITLASFNGTSRTDPEGLILGKDGNFYGVTQFGGASGYGSIFEVTSGGTITNLYSFGTGGIDGGLFPTAGLTQGTDGYFYGTTNDGGFSLGTVFRFNQTSTENLTFDSASAIPLTTTAYVITGSALSVNLSFAPTIGTVLTAVHPTREPIHGTFTNLANRGTITATYGSLSYIFTANYSGGSGNDLTLTLTSILPATTETFSQWATQYSLTGGATGTSQHDVIPNLLKFFTDINPTMPMTATDRAALPVFALTTIKGAPYLTLTYRENSLMSGVTVNIQTSPDLQTWTTVTNPTIIQTGTDASTGNPIMQAQVSASGSKMFVRLRLTLL